MGMHSSSDAFKYIESFTNLERSTSGAQTEYKLERMAYMLEERTGKRWTCIYKRYKR